jgi:hypothetical protein
MIFLKKNRFDDTILWSALLMVLLLLGIGGWLLLAQYAQVRTVRYVIPAGAGQRLAGGERVITLPTEIDFVIGVRDILMVENQDEVVHNFGPFMVLPHTTLVKRFKNVRVYQGACSLHRDRQMRLVVHPAPWNIFQEGATGLE